MNPETKMPAIFIGHGSPMNAIEDNLFSRAWIETGKILPRPKGLSVQFLCVRYGLNDVYRKKEI